MRVEPIPCSQATGYSSPTALAFVRSPEQFAEHFPSTAELLSSGSLSGSSPLSTSEREALVRAIELSCAGIELSALQRQHLRELLSAEALAIVTGQQVGFLGGPAYTLFKALAAILWAQRFRAQRARPVVPVFWIEDNDSDGREAGLLHWWTPEGELRLLQADRPEALQTPYSVAVRSFPPAPDAPWRQALEYVCPQLPLDLAELLQQSISPERSWSQAFLALLQYRLGKHGILLLRASVAREQGLFVPILQRALEEEQQLHELLQRGIQRLQQQGYPAQILPTAPLLHFHTAEGLRYRVRRLPDGSYAIGQQHYSAEQLRALFRERPTAFSPTALLRPLCQDRMLRSAAVVVGPTELAYWGQLRELYEAFSVRMPAVLPRPSLTLVPPAIERLLQREQWSARDLLVPWHTLEAALIQDLPQLREGERRLEELRQAINRWQHDSAHLVRSLEPSLERSAAATAQRILRLLERWHRRLRAASRRRMETRLHRLKRIWSCLYPDGQPQERMLGWVQLELLCGAGSLDSALEKSLTLPWDSHALVYPGEPSAALPPPPSQGTAQVLANSTGPTPAPPHGTADSPPPSPATPPTR